MSTHQQRTARTLNALVRIVTLVGIATVMTLVLVTPAAGEERTESFRTVPDTSRSVVTVEEAKALVEADAEALDPSCWDPATRSSAGNAKATHAVVTKTGGFTVRKVTVASVWANPSAVTVVRLCAS